MIRDILPIWLSSFLMGFGLKIPQIGKGKGGAAPVIPQGSSVTFIGTMIQGV